jgi:hypothetical protein
MPKKLTIEEVRNFVNENSQCQLISETYEGNNKKLNFICACNKPFTTTFYDFKTKNKRQCNDCSYNNLGSKLAYNYDFVKKYIEDMGYLLLSKEYVSCKEDLILLCPNNHIFNMNFDHFKNHNNRCPYCCINKKKTIEEIKSNLLEYGFELLSPEYKNNNQELEILCTNNHKILINYVDFQTKIKIGTVCRECKLNEQIVYSTELNKYLRNHLYL